MKKPSPPYLTRQNALFLDFDGTITKLQKDRDAVFLSASSSLTVESAAQFLGGALAIITGRALADVKKRLGAAVPVIASHGLEHFSVTGNQMDPVCPSRLRTAFKLVEREFPGAELEVKGPILAMHFRNAPQFEEEITQRLQKAASTFKDYRLQKGKMVLEAKPPAANKGAALGLTMKLPLFQGRTPVMIGDDATDEDAIAKAQELGGYGVKVGAGGTGASYRLDGAEEVMSWLRESVAAKPT